MRVAGDEPGDGPIVVAYGLGVDSTAVLVEFVRLGVVPDLILFADTGDEKPETYAFMPVMQAFLSRHGMPAVQTVRYAPRHNRYKTLEENCLANGTLPSLAFGRKACSLKFKVKPQDAYVKTWGAAQRAWADGQQVRKVIGYDAGPADMRRGKDLKPSKKYSYWYPLREWGWDRERCKRAIVEAGLPLPCKSACFYCPASQTHEIDDLIVRHPELAARIVTMEDQAQPKLVKIDGLWRKARKRDGRPGSMAAYIRRRLPILTEGAAE